MDNTKTVLRATENATLLDEMAEELRAYEWAINACGRPGTIEMQKVRASAPQVLKMLINYIE